ncbi:hypothetical protein PQD13_gp35 [Gordonia phage Clawz]|uniref:Uncharacterized protein n=1 Tax=Gordonia phage Clawz TaxID=2743910 RepID=A0AAE7F9N2_9CAUD|nr:hypothetical protein PQD13_gp35 [Gordonia phage Clawz]QKY79947.1 hypothetical protein SEA_CLAWZ_35 [Gordonia phage Clawz]
MKQPRDYSDIHRGLSMYCGSQTRLKVETVYYDPDDGGVVSTHVRCGRIGMTTGRRPALLLMARATSIGSSDLILPDTPTRVTRVIAVKDGNQYRPTRQPAITSRVGWHELEDA